MTSASRYQTVGRHFLDAAERVPDRPFIQRSKGSLSYGDAVIHVAATATVLEHLGVQRGDHVVCYLEDREQVTLFGLACATIGTIPAPIAAPYSLDYCCRHFVKPLDSRVVFTVPEHVTAFRAEGAVPVCYTPESGSLPSEAVALDTGSPMEYDRALAFLREREEPVSVEDTVIIQATSGSTGRPKLVMRKHLAPARYARFVGEQLTEEPETGHRFLYLASLVHAFGFHMFTVALAKAATLGITTRADTTADLEEIRALDPTVLPMVPRVQRSLYEQYRKIGGTEAGSRMFGPSARYACSAGGAPDVEVLDLLASQGVSIIEFYGSTEASAIAVTRCGEWEHGSAGRVLPDTDVRVADDGELLVRSPGVTHGYYGDAALTAEAFNEDGYFYTGDLGEVAEDGKIHIKGRKHETFNTPDGSNIFPTHIEGLLEATDCIRQALLIGHKRPYLAALIVLSEDLASRIAHDSDGPVSMGRFPSLYDQVGAALSAVNARLEIMEQVVRYALFTQPFREELYATVGPGKIRRRRHLAAKEYADVVEFLYGKAAPRRSRDSVPGVALWAWKDL